MWILTTQLLVCMGINLHFLLGVVLVLFGWFVGDDGLRANRVLVVAVHTATHHPVLHKRDCRTTIHGVVDKLASCWCDLDLHRG